VSSSWKASIDFAAVSDVGMRRSNNQDAHAAIPADSEERLRSRGHLFLVADGMGAHAAGELASRIASERVPLYYLRQSACEAIDALRDSVERANRDIYQSGQQNREFHNMGTTVSTLAILPEGAIVAHVGDSRVYRLRGGRLEQLTFDHSLVWEMQTSGQIKPDSQLSSSIPKNIITRSLGPAPAVDVDVEGPFAILPGDRFLLCSDGLTGQIEDAEIGPLLAVLTPDVAAQVLVDLANLRGGPDNITVIVVDVGEHRKPAPLPPVPKATIPRESWGLATAAVVGLAVAIWLGLSEQWPTMSVVLLVSLIAAVFAYPGFIPAVKPKSASSATRSLLRGDSKTGSSGSRRSPPYRSTLAKPSGELLNQLDQVLAALREAARERRWKIDWDRVDSILAGDQELRKQGQLAGVIRLQAKAIVETMSQLRHQQLDNNVTVLG